MMYKLMIVDDEADIREGLMEIVDFASLGFRVVAEAENGIEGLRLAEVERPDLVITDIRMPLLDGLSMAAQMRKMLPTVRFIILSGYDEFEYARQAIEVTALRYLLKPITSKEITEILKDVKARMDEEFARQRDMLRLRASFEESLPLMREALLSSLLQGRLDGKRAYAMAARYEMKIDSPAYALAFIRAHERQGESASIGDSALLSIAVKRMAGEFIDEQKDGYLFHYQDMLAALFLLPDGGRDGYDRALEKLDALRQNADHFLNCQISIGVGAVCPSLSALPNCATQAVTALNHIASSGESQVICITDIAPESGSVIVANDHLLQALSNAVKMGDSDKAREAIARLMGVCRREKPALRDYRTYLFEILMTFFRIGRDLNISRPPNDAPDSYEQIMRSPPVDQAEKLFIGIADHFARSVAERRGSSARHFVQEAVAFIDAQYADEELTIEKTCNHLHISASYFSAIFRKETQKTFSQYLTERRMEQAMNLLATSELRTAEIAQRVGVPDPSYFSFSFKKHFGVSPSHIRKGGSTHE